MTLKQGEEAVIVGQSGSGKTTLLRLISGMLLSSSGTLRINKIPIEECDLSSLRQHIRIVHADDILFTGSILDNIACFDSAPDKEQVIAACRLAEVDHVVARLPHGYETEMLPGNTFFSAGEMQRLVLARALYSQPKLLLCDEVTANPDKTTAQKVLANLRSSGIGRYLLPTRRTWWAVRGVSIPWKTAPCGRVSNDVSAASLCPTLRAPGRTHLNGKPDCAKLQPVYALPGGRCAG